MQRASGKALPGARNLITDVAGLKVGQSEAVAARSGVTVILPDARAVCAVDVRGGAPGTRETEALAPENLVEAVDAVVLSGGSVYGLAAADGVVGWLGARGRGYALATDPTIPPSPVVPAAILFDMPNGGDKRWGEEPPYRALGAAAVAEASQVFRLGTAGAGYGAMAGSLKGGIGSASIVSAEGFTVGAIVAVNAWGSVVAPGGRTFWAAPFEVDDEFGGLGPAGLLAAADDWGLAKGQAALRNTTLACVATDVALTPVQARRVAIMGQDGLARAIRPVHAPFDGDVVYALSTAIQPCPDPADLTVARLGALAADVLARAVARAVYEATPWPGSAVACWRDLG
jgi:L-aminopeptidase/D-esterase-like protein